MPHRQRTLRLFGIYQKINSITCCAAFPLPKKISGATLIFREPCLIPCGSVEMFIRLARGWWSGTLPLPKNIGCNPHFSRALYMSVLLSFSERKTFARCLDKSLVARLRCSSDLLGVGGAARSLFPKNIGCNPHFSGALYMSALLSFSERKTFARYLDKSLAARLGCLSDLLGVGGAARSLFPKNFG